LPEPLVWGTVPEEWPIYYGPADRFPTVKRGSRKETHSKEIPSSAILRLLVPSPATFPPISASLSPQTLPTPRPIPTTASRFPPPRPLPRSPPGVQPPLPYPFLHTPHTNPPTLPASFLLFSQRRADSSTTSLPCRLRAMVRASFVPFFSSSRFKIKSGVFI